MPKYYTTEEIRTIKRPPPPPERIEEMRKRLPELKLKLSKAMEERRRKKVPLTLTQSVMRVLMNRMKGR